MKSDFKKRSGMIIAIFCAFLLITVSLLSLVCYLSFDQNYREIKQSTYSALCGQIISDMETSITYGKRIDDFRAIMEAMGAQPIKNGDAGYELEFMPGLRLQLMMWEADDEFPPSAQFLFSDNFPEAFAPEDLAVVGDVTLNAMKETEAWLKANK